MKGLDRNAPSVPPQNTPQEAQQVDMWKKYIQWEKSNPLRTEDQTLITKRGNKINSLGTPITCMLGHLILSHKLANCFLPLIFFSSVLFRLNNFYRSISMFTGLYFIYPVCC